ncbi:MAG: hypothetical protein AAF985_17910, partial [Bacteroidota bacterium]
KTAFLRGLMFTFLFLNCCKNDCETRRTEFVWSSNKSIAIDPEVETVMMGDSLISIIEYRTTEGQDILFEYNEFFSLCDDEILDGTSSRKFLMVIPADSTSSFSYKDQEILATSAFLDIFAAPDSRPHQWVQEGEIIGKKLDDDRWRVSIEVITTIQAYGMVQGDQPRVISIDTVFTLE